MEPINPYQPPHASDSIASRKAPPKRRGRWRLCSLWILAFAANSILPTLMFWPTTEQCGRVGMSIAASVLLLFGCVLCLALREFGRMLVTGAFVVAFSQLLPVLQITACVIGINTVGLIERKGFGSPQAFSELTSFISTLMAGALLLAASILLGLILRAYTPQRWWVKREPKRSNRPSGLDAEPLFADSIVHAAAMPAAADPPVPQPDQSGVYALEVGRIVTIERPGFSE